MVQALSKPTPSRQGKTNPPSTEVTPRTGTAALLEGHVSDFSQVSLEDAIYRSRKYARLVTLACGETSSEAAIAWEELDELLSARAGCQRQRPLSSFEQYCTLNPDAMECRLYDA